MTREEAIEVYHGLINTKIKEAFEFFAPELRESEDERTRMALCDIVRDMPYMETELRAHGLTVEKTLAYLEKQKEPIDPFDTKLFQDGVKEGRRLEREDIKKEQKPAEWSEEDEKKITFLERLIKYNVPEGQYGWIDGHRGGFVTKLEAISMLKSLRPSKDCSSCAKNLEGYISGRCDAENKLLEQFGALVTPEGELHIKPRWKPSEVCYGAKGDPDPAGVWKPSEEQPQVADASKMEQSEGYLEYWLEHFGMPKESIENCADQIAQGYGASRFLEGVRVGAEAVNELGKQEKGYDEAYLNECIAKASKTWKGVDVDKYLEEVRGREPEQSEVDLEKAIDEYFGDGGQWKSGFCVGKKGFLKIARHFYELGLNATKED